MTTPVEAGGAGFDTQWDGKFAYEIRRSVIAAVDADRSMRCVADAIATRYNDDAFQRIIYSESHDEVANGKARVPYEINKVTDLKQIMALQVLVTPALVVDGSLRWRGGCRRWTRL